MQKKTFTAVLTRSQLKTQSPIAVQCSPTGAAVQNLLDEKRFSSLRRLVGTVAWIWRAAKKFLHAKRGDEAKWGAIPSSSVITVSKRKNVFLELCLAAQEGVNFPNTTTDRLVVYKDQVTGILMCGGRIQAFKEDHNAVPLLPYQAWVSTLLAREAHSEGHDGAAGTLLWMRKRAWVIRGRILAQKAVDNCIICKKERARTCQQIMGDLPEERVNPAAPFQFTSVDLFGPYQVKDDVRRRASMKVWGVLFCCMSSRAIHVELANTLTTESFLLAYQRFTSIRGHPQKIWSDPGTNFIGAKPVLEEMYTYLRQLNKESLEEYAAKNGTCWTWKILPADSPHRNGAAEAAVKVTKRALQSLGGGGGLTFSEFLTVLKLAANLANERPIDARVQSREDRINYVTPNTLLLGRATQTGDFKTVDYTTYPFKRLQEMQTQVSHFWRSWSQLAGPNLFIRSKWHTAKSNVAVGDIVWLCDQNALRGQFKLARVVSVNADSKGIVRDVHVKVPLGGRAQVKTPKPTEKSWDPQGTTLHRDVRRLIVLLPVEEQVSRDQLA
ncbi:methyltransferase-like protein 23 isoform X1 [Neoarius graeffei]|uniref:methyltransferase-like protein 23 isoform X1 n=1 Tax=Neoarius graeffei TaxID=443677 RepID=UPI00298CF38A|nr:methyltransferase-like protein 23 isoform X1 [Neoarius graeffei]XP_060757416.1 methyltransferase-like protein 23 isoform X1 [Neoarius graeffei]